MLEKFYNKWKILVNAGKTEVIVFAKKFKSIQILNPIKVHNNKINPTNNAKYLGVHLDLKLTFKQHIKQVLIKAYSVLRKLYPLMVKN